MASLQLQLLSSWNHHRSFYGHYHPPCPGMLIPLCTLSKQGQRFFGSLNAASAIDNPSATNRSIRKFIGSSSKSVVLNALSHLLCPTTSHPHLSFLALPLYSVICKEPWFCWNHKLVAEVVALLYKQENFDGAESLISETVSKLEFRERELCTFYCNMLDFNSKHKSKQGVFDSYARLKQLFSQSSSVYLKRQAYKSLISGLCDLNLPHEAETLIEEMKELGFKPSVFEFRSVIYAYGGLGLFEDLKRNVVLMEGQGFGIDTVCSNMVLSTLGAHTELLEMVAWLQRMKELGIPFSVRTYNSVLNSCPTIMSMLQDLKTVPLSIDELMKNLHWDEALLVQELIGSSVLVEAMEWESSEHKLDLHGMHLGSAYLIMLQWFGELRSRFLSTGHVVPAEIVVVCGRGKHSTVRGESPVKGLVKEMIVRMRSPMRIDRKNIGCFVAKGKVLKGWLC